MKHLSFRCLMALCLTAALPVSLSQETAVAVPAGDVNPEAATVMDSYFLALASGDSASLRTLLGGDLLVKRERLLDNPAYSGHLKNTYQGVDFNVLKYENNGPDSLTVEALISFAEGETVRKRYQLERSVSQAQSSSFVIVSETTIAEPILKQGIQ